MCKVCHLRAFTAKGKAKLLLKECLPVDVRMQLRPRAVEAAPAEAAVGQWASSQIQLPGRGGRQHRMAQAGPVHFCLLCGCYAMHVGRGLRDNCLGLPTGSSSKDVARRKKRLLLLEGRHPATKALLEGLDVGDIARNQRWGEMAVAASRSGLPAGS